MTDLINKSIENARFEFRSDGTFNAIGVDGPGTKTGKWSLNGKEIELTLGSAKTQRERPTLTVTNESTIHEIQPRHVELDWVKTK